MKPHTRDRLAHAPSGSTQNSQCPPLASGTACSRRCSRWGGCRWPSATANSTSVGWSGLPGAASAGAVPAALAAGDRDLLAPAATGPGAV